MLKRNRAQSIGEYVVLLTIVVSVAAMMFPMVKRGTQSLIRAGADQIAGQQNSEQEFNGEGGYTVNQFSNSKSTHEYFKYKRLFKSCYQGFII